MKSACLLFALLLAQIPATVSFEGIVVQSGTATPVAKATVEISPRGDGEPLTSITSADGKFTFKDLSPGRYAVRAFRDGYLPAPAREVLLQPGARTDPLRLSLTATGAIAGHVLDSTGDPMAYVSVQALQHSWTAGHAELTVIQSAETNDRGEFRLFWLPPGRYYLSIAPNSTSTGLVRLSNGAMARAKDGQVVRNGSPSASRNEIKLLPVYYPGTADPRAAAGIDVDSGSDIRGIDFVLSRVATHRVRAVAVDSATGAKVDTASLTLVPRNGSTLSQFPLITISQGDGFEAYGVLPGSYFLIAGARDSARGARVIGGQTQVEVGDQDVDGIVVSLSPGMNLTGRVVMDAASPAVDGSPTIALYSEVLGSTLRSQVFAQFSNASQFTLRDVLPGDYRVQVLSAPGGTYVKSVRLGATDILSTPFRLEPSLSRGTMEVVLGTDGGTLSGSVVTTTGGVREAVPGVTVALIPGGNLRNRTDLYRSATTNESGQFQLAGIAPGDYTAFALETAEEGLWREPEFIRRNERLGHAIRVTKASQERVEMSIGHTP